ncbi:hypothetical protein VTL71DRAFT_16535 [Oculimacula yallundae]|uniref:Amine oxidase n=1 Tax=Oculimacula yallundae TaxID=86028 RepID=A0ABR4CEP8_9HELO
MLSDLANGNLPVVDAIVVGAGFSGLAAATKLAASGKSVIVYEALDRVGGKVYDKVLPNGGIVETGAEFVGTAHTRLLELAKELEVETFKTYSAGKMVGYSRKERIVYDPHEQLAPVDEAGLLQLGAATQELEAMAQELDLHAPWNHPRAKIWDSLTYETWLDKAISHPESRAVLNLTTKGLLSAEPADVSLLQILSYIAKAHDETISGGNLQRLVSIKGGAQEFRFTGGPQLIALKLAERLGKHIQLESAVRKITKENGIFVVSGDNFSGRARAVIMTLSPPLAGRIVYSPSLPTRRDQLTQKMAMGSLGKVIAIYKEPFWRKDGLSGECIGLDGIYATSTFDTSPEDGSYGAMLGFLTGDTMRFFNDKTEEEIQEAVVEDFVKYLGEEARNVESWVIQRWDNEEFARGGHFALCSPNVMTQVGSAISEPVGNLFFAGTEASPVWAGFMEGAIRAGEIAAEKIIQLKPGTCSAE